MVELEKCPAEIVLGDDAEGGSCTFHCELPAGHPNYHQVTGSRSGQRYEVLWWLRPGAEAGPRAGGSQTQGS